MKIPKKINIATRTGEPRRDSVLAAFERDIEGRNIVFVITHEMSVTHARSGVRVFSLDDVVLSVGRSNWKNAKLYPIAVKRGVALSAARKRMDDVIDAHGSDRVAALMAGRATLNMEFEA